MYMCVGRKLACISCLIQLCTGPLFVGSVEDVDSLTLVDSPWASSILAYTRHWECDLAVDNQNEVHLVYVDSRSVEEHLALMYITNAHGIWKSSQIASWSGPSAPYWHYPHIAIDSEQFAHVSFWDSGARALYYATDKGGSWSTYQVASGLWCEAFNDIAIDSKDRVHICYYSHFVSGFPDWCVVHTTLVNDSWSKTVVGQGLVTPLISLAVDTEDRLHVCYCDNFQRNLRYSSFNGSDWKEVDVDPTGSYPSLGIDSDDEVRMVYANDDDDIVEARKIADNFTTSVIGHVTDCRGTSVAVDSDGVTHAVFTNQYWSSESGWVTELKYSKSESAAWSTVRLYSYPYSLYSAPAMAVDSLGKVYVAYINRETGTLNYFASSGIPPAPALECSRVGVLILNWHGPSATGASIQSYRIYRVDNQGNVNLVTELDADKTTYACKSELGRISSSYYYVTAVNSFGESGFSNRIGGFYFGPIPLFFLALGLSSAATAEIWARRRLRSMLKTRLGELRSQLDALPSTTRLDLENEYQKLAAMYDSGRLRRSRRLSKKFKAALDQRSRHVTDGSRIIESIHVVLDEAREVGLDIDNEAKELNDVEAILKGR